MKKCELCKSPARMYCDSDQASLCFDCDAKVHAANFLVAKHTRTLLCNLCQSLTPWTASGPKLIPTASVCNNCIDDSNFREEIRNENRRNSDEEEEDDDDRNHRGEDGSDDDDSGGGGVGDDDDDEDENQVVPWSSTAPPPASSSSNSDRESYSARWNSNSDESSSFQSISVCFRSSSSVFQKNQKKEMQKRGQNPQVKQRRSSGVVNDNF